MLYFEDLHLGIRQRLADLNPQHLSLLEPYLTDGSESVMSLEQYRRRVEELKQEMLQGIYGAQQPS